MPELHENPSNIRRGRFLWMEENGRSEYIRVLKEKIRKGHFRSDSILSQVAENLAPIYVDSAVSD
jgi:hypothetical protein